MEKLVNRLAFTKLILVAKIEDWLWTWKNPFQSIDVMSYMHK